MQVPKAKPYCIAPCICLKNGARTRHTPSCARNVVYVSRLNFGPSRSWGWICWGPFLQRGRYLDAGWRATKRLGARLTSWIRLPILVCGTMPKCRTTPWFGVRAHLRTSRNGRARGVNQRGSDWLKGNRPHKRSDILQTLCPPQSGHDTRSRKAAKALSWLILPSCASSPIARSRGVVDLATCRVHRRVEDLPVQRSLGHTASHAGSHQRYALADRNLFRGRQITGRPGRLSGA